MRYGQVIGIDPQQTETYITHHKNCWEDVKAKITECNIRNYSIFIKNDMLFAYFEYVGNDYEADMAKMAADLTTQKWWDVVGKAQRPLKDRAPGEWWANMEEVFHQD